MPKRQGNRTATLPGPRMQSPTAVRYLRGLRASVSSPSSDGGNAEVRRPLRLRIPFVLCLNDGGAQEGDGPGEVFLSRCRVRAGCDLGLEADDVEALRVVVGVPHGHAHHDWRLLPPRLEVERRSGRSSTPRHPARDRASSQRWSPNGSSSIQWMPQTALVSKLGPGSTSRGFLRAHLGLADGGLVLLTRRPGRSPSVHVSPGRTRSGCRDLNPGPLDPQSSALTKLRHSPRVVEALRRGAYPDGSPERGQDQNDLRMVLHPDRGAVRNRGFPWSRALPQRIVLKHRRRRTDFTAVATIRARHAT